MVAPNLFYTTLHSKSSDCDHSDVSDLSVAHHHLSQITKPKAPKKRKFKCLDVLIDKLTASIQCWKANFCAFESSHSPLPICKKQIKFHKIVFCHFNKGSYYQSKTCLWSNQADPTPPWGYSLRFVVIEKRNRAVTQPRVVYRLPPQNHPHNFSGQGKWANQTTTTTKRNVWHNKTWSN